MSGSDGRAVYPCFACGGTKTSLHADIPNLDTLIAPLLPKVAISVCDACGLVHQNPCITREQMSGIYSRIEDKVTVENLEHSTSRQEALSRVEALKKLLPPPARLFEVGCSDGTFLAAAKEAGYTVRGVDPSEENIAKAKRLHPGLNASVGFAEDLEATGDVDVVCHFYVLEHSFEPLKFLGTLRRFLKKGGLMFFEVPDVSRFASLPFANFLFPYQHTIHLSPETASDLLARAGFETLPMSDRSSSKSYGMRFAAKMGEPAVPVTSRAASSRKQLNDYFGRRQGILNGMKASVETWAKEAAGRAGPCVIFGAGENGRVLLQETDVRALFPKLLFTDNNAALHGKEVDGVKVLSPGDAAAAAPCLVITASIDYQDDMRRQLLGLGVEASRIVRLYS